MSDKKLGSLVTDIYEVMGEGAEVPKEQTDSFASHLAGIFRDRLGEDRGRDNYLRPSNIGEKCDRKLWYSINHPELGEKLDGQTRLKFLLGDLWEAVVLFLAGVAGHRVEGQQDTVSIGDIAGSRDAVIDGTVVDVKSASTYSFHKFADHLTPDKDAFGYLGQLDFYLSASLDDPLVTNKNQAAFLVGDKTLGALTLDVHNKKDTDYHSLIATKKAMLASTALPPRGYTSEPMGKSGNMKLGVNCSYCPFKKACWPNVRTFLYSSGPVFLTQVTKEPNVSEVF